jgi:hypothetical protein
MRDTVDAMNTINTVAEASSDFVAFTTDELEHSSLVSSMMCLFSITSCLKTWTLGRLLLAQQFSRPLVSFVCQLVFSDSWTDSVAESALRSTEFRLSAPSAKCGR